MNQARDWLDWHREYDDPCSSLSRRRLVIQRYLRRILAELPPAPDGEPARLLSLCAGDGEDLLGVLAESAGIPPVRALLVELDAELAGRAARRVAELRLHGVRVRTGDAGRPADYAELLPAQIVLACGVFGNIGDNDVRRTVDALPAMLEPGGWVIWTRGRGADGKDASEPIRRLFGAHGFTEVDFTAPADAKFRVGLHRLDRPAAGTGRLPEQLFRFSQA